MSTYFQALASSLLLLIAVNMIGFSKPVLPDLNYCIPVVVKENVSIEKLQIGNWTAAQPNAIVPIATFGNNPNYDFSIQGLPLTRDTFYWQIWLDLNQDLDFDDEGETFLKTVTSRKQKALGKLTFPSALYGNALVRIMLTRGKANNACGTAGKVLGYYDFWLQGNCIELSKTQWQLEEVLQNEARLKFNWPASTIFHWQLKGEKETRWRTSGIVSGNSLVLQNLNDFNVYSFRYQLKCGDENWTRWSDTVRIETLYKPVCSPIDTAQISIDSVGANHVFITVQPQENSEVYQYSFFSPTGKGDTVSGSATYGQTKINLRLWDAEYQLIAVKKQCLDGSSSTWNYDKRSFNTPIKIDRICPAPSLDSVTVIFTNNYNINLTYTGKEHSKVIWNYPSYYQDCSLKSDTTQRELNVWYKNGERISVRLKGFCASEKLSPFSDTLWFERPCEGTKTSDFFVKQITDKTADVWIKNVDFCSGGYYYYVTTDTTLHDSLWRKLPDPGGRYITLKNLLPNTQYFIKVSNQCYNNQNSILYSGFQSFKTLPTISTCEAFDSSEISFRFDEQEQLLWVRVNSSKVSVAKELTWGDANGYQFTTRVGFTGDSTRLNWITTDTKYSISIQNTCGTLKSEWTTVTHAVTAACPKMNSARLRHTLKDNKYYLGYDVNPELPIPGPYLLRYRTAVYGSPWLDTLLLNTSAIEIPLHLLGQYAAFSIRPLSNLACGEEYWSSDISLQLTPCPAALRADFALKSATSNSAIFYIHGDRLPDNTSLRVYDPGGSVPEFEIDLSATDTEVTINGLVPNFRYYASLCSHCQIGPTFYGNCLASFDFKTPKESVPPKPGITIAKTTLLNKLKLVPNPSTGFFQLELPTGLEGTATLTVTDINGKVILRTPLQLFLEANPKLDLSQQSQGVYFIHLQFGNQYYREKLVLIR